jgi:hypothetical protein
MEKIAVELFNHIVISDVVAEVGLKRAADGIDRMTGILEDLDTKTRL